MWICFGIGCIVGFGIAIVGECLNPRIETTYVDRKCCECNNFRAGYCYECSTELSKR